ncbi:hypothetical protein [Ktedonobacter racemifer]|uniref:hypothetical protein n=1 Tax=Ktedonobacter racemifer TaxID=363277 RepID=UPI0012FB8731|nr:hypothetical protein [Ktedonobacter racemifer]
MPPPVARIPDGNTIPEVIAPPLSPMACSPRLRVRETSVMSRYYRVGSLSTTFLARRGVRFGAFERSLPKHEASWSGLRERLHMTWKGSAYPILLLDMLTPVTRSYFQRVRMVSR